MGWGGGGGGGGVKISRGWRFLIFDKFNKQGGQNKRGGVGISKNPLISVMNKKRHV